MLFATFCLHSECPFKHRWRHKWLLYYNYFLSHHRVAHSNRFPCNSSKCAWKSKSRQPNRHLQDLSGEYDLVSNKRTTHNREKHTPSQGICWFLCHTSYCEDIAGTTHDRRHIRQNELSTPMNTCHPFDLCRLQRHNPLETAYRVSQFTQQEMFVRSRNYLLQLIQKYLTLNQTLLDHNPHQSVRSKTEALSASAYRTGDGVIPCDSVVFPRLLFATVDTGVVVDSKPHSFTSCWKKANTFMKHIWS